MMGEKNRPKHVELTLNNKLTYIVASRWLFSQLYHEARIHEHQIFLNSLYPSVHLAVHSSGLDGHWYLLNEK